MRKLILFLLFISSLSAQIRLGPTNKQVRGTLPIVNGGTGLGSVCSNLQGLVSNGTIYVCTNILPTINGAGAGSNFNGSTPAAPSNAVNVDWQISGSDVSANLLYSNISTAIFGSGSGWTWTFDAGTTDPRIVVQNGNLIFGGGASNVFQVSSNWYGANGAWPFRVDQGSASLPGITNRNNTDVGIQLFASTNEIAFNIGGGTEAMRIGNAAQTVKIEDTTATTGDTELVVKQGAGQTSAPLQVVSAADAALFSVNLNGGFGGPGRALASLGTPANGTLEYCTDCLIGSNPCSASSSGAYAFRINGSWNCSQGVSAGAGDAFGVIGNATADSLADTLTVTDSATIDFTTTNDPEDLTAIVIANSIDASHIDETDDYTWSGSNTFSQNILVTDGTGDTPSIKFTPQTGTVWDLFVEDTTDDLQIQSNTANTETIDIVNTGVGVANLSVEGSISGINVTSGADPGHTHTTTSISGLDISADTNLAVTSPVILTDDTLSLNQNAGTDITADLEEETHATEHQHGGGDEVATATPGANAIVKAEADGDINVGWIPLDADYSWIGTHVFTDFQDKGSEVYNVKAYGAIGDGVTDDTTAIQDAIDAVPARGGIVFLPAGTYKISSTLTLGDGTSGGASTLNNIQIVGVGIGSSPNETGVLAKATELQWFGATSGTMMTINGPIGGVRLENLVFQAYDGTDRADTCFVATHVFNSIFRNIRCDDFTGVGIDVTAYTSVASVAIGGNNNAWESVKIRSAQNSATGLRIGAADGPGLNVAKNNFRNLQVYLNGTTPVGINIRFADNLTFMQCDVYANATGAGTGLLVSVPVSATTFPGDVTFYQYASVSDVVVSGSWTGDRGFLFWPYNDDASNNLPVGTIFGGITTEGEIFGSPFKNFKHRNSANVASSATTTLPNGNLFHITGTTNITTLNTCSSLHNGRVVYLIFDGVLTFTDGSNLKLAGNFVTTADDTINLVCDGTNWYELSRSVN